MPEAGAPLPPPTPPPLDDEPPIEPARFDLVVLGTGLVETLVAAAAARAGRGVLNLDPDGRYGSGWAGLGLGDMERWVASLPARPGGAGGVGAAGCFGGICFRSKGAAMGGADRDFTLDIAAPKLALSAGPLVDVIVRSGAHNYLEFKHLDGSYMLGEGARLQRVPASRADVFKDKDLSLAEKRVLMRFLKAALEGWGGSGDGGAVPAPQGTFAAWLEAEGLPARLRDVVAYAIALCESDPAALPAADGVARLRAYLGSIDRYGQGQGALLATYYGTSELPQAFSRVAAVAGAIQVLRRPVERVVVGEGGAVTGVVTAAGQTIGCERLALSADAAPALLPPPAGAAPPAAGPVVARAVCILDAPIVSGTGQALIVVAPPAEGGAAVYALQLGAGAAVCPAGRWVLYLATGRPTGGVETAEAALRPALDAILAAAAQGGAHGDGAGGVVGGDGEGVGVGAGAPPQPAVLWAAFYSQPAGGAGAKGADLPPNAAACAGPDASATFGSAVLAAEAVFARLCPGEAFLPPPPEEVGAGADSDDEEVDAILAGVAAAAAPATGGGGGG